MSSEQKLACPQGQPVFRRRGIRAPHARPICGNNADLVPDREVLLGHLEEAGSYQWRREEEDMFLLGVTLVAVAKVCVFDGERVGAATGRICRKREGAVEAGVIEEVVWLWGCHLHQREAACPRLESGNVAAPGNSDRENLLLNEDQSCWS